MGAWGAAGVLAAEAWRLFGGQRIRRAFQEGEEGRRARAGYGKVGYGAVHCGPRPCQAASSVARPPARVALPGSCGKLPSRLLLDRLTERRRCWEVNSSAGSGPPSRLAARSATEAQGAAGATVRGFGGRNGGQGSACA